MPTDNQIVQALRAKANQLRIDCIRATSAAGSGHPTSCLSAAEIVATLFFKVMRYDAKDPENSVNDRFVLSKGHAAPILYAAWAEAGLFTRDRLLTLRQVDSDLEGHPTPRLPFVDVATGSLGQGLSAGVGLALNAKYLDRTDYRVYVLLGDGEAAEGSVWEAAELASYSNLDNLIAIVDVNRLGQSQPTMLQHDVEAYRARFEAFGWAAVAVDGHDVEQLLDAFGKIGKLGEKPYAIIARTIKGKGVSFAEDKNGWHGKPFKQGEEEQKAVAEVESQGLDSGGVQLKIKKPSASAPTQIYPGKLDPPDYAPDSKAATREAYGTALVKLGAADPRIVVLDADTKNSTFAEKFLKAYPERFFEGFIAEQNLISVGAGLASRGRIPFVSSFAVFLSRGFDQVRMAGISRSNLKLCGSHVGVSIGEDGPSQMGLEDIALFRTIPECVVFYPSDAVAAERAVALAAEHKGMAYIRTSRPKTPILYDNSEEFAIGKAKVLRKSDKDVLTIATGGVTLFEALKAYDELQKDGISVRVIDLFTIKPIDEATLIGNARETGNLILTVEDHYPQGGIGEAVLSAVGETDIRVHKIAVQEIPRSGEPDVLLAKYGIDAKAIIGKVKSLAG